MWWCCRVLLHWSIFLSKLLVWIWVDQSHIRMPQLLKCLSWDSIMSMWVYVHRSWQCVFCRLGEVTLRDFKAAVDRQGSFRYHFKALDPEFGTVKEEVGVGVKLQPLLLFPSASVGKCKNGSYGVRYANNSCARCALQNTTGRLISIPKNWITPSIHFHFLSKPFIVHYRCESLRYVNAGCWLFRCFRMERWSLAGRGRS